SGREADVGRWDPGQVGGFGAAENLASIIADLPIALSRARSIAHQAAGLGPFATGVYRRQGMTRCQRYKIVRMRKKKWAADDEERLGALLGERGKGGRNFALVAGSKDDQSLSGRACRCRHIVALQLCGSRGRVWQ